MGKSGLIIVYGIDELVKIQLKRVSLLDNTRFDELYKLGYKIMKEKLHKRNIFLKK